MLEGNALVDLSPCLVSRSCWLCQWSLCFALVACLFWLVTVTQIPAMSGWLHKHFLKQALQSLRRTQSRGEWSRRKWSGFPPEAEHSFDGKRSNQTDECWRRGFCCRIGVCCVTDSRGMRPAALVVAVKGCESNQTSPSASCLAQHPLQTLKMSRCCSKIPVVLNLIPISFWFVENTCDILLKSLVAFSHLGLWIWSLDVQYFVMSLSSLWGHLHLHL